MKIHFADDDEFVYDRKEINDNDLRYFEERAKIYDVMAIVLKDMKSLPLFSFLYLDKSKESAEFLSVVDANRKIQQMYVDEFTISVEARLNRNRSKIDRRGAFVTGMERLKGNRKSDKKTKPKACSLSGCSKAGTFSCPTPVSKYCDGRNFCADHCKLHSDHFGEGSKLKRAPKETNERSNNPLDLVSSSDDDGAVIIRSDIYCAVIECEGIAEFFCEGSTKKCRGRKFCITHGTLCSRHIAQSFRPIALGESSNIQSESDSESSIDLAATGHRLQINSHSSIVQTMTVNEASGVIEPPTANVISSVIEATSGNVVNENIEVIDATIAQAASDNYGLQYILEPLSLSVAIDDALKNHLLEPTGKDYVFTKRSVKPGVMILYHYNDAWHLAKISVSRLSEQGKLRINFVNDKTVWLDVELNIDHHGPDQKKWILMRNVT